MIAPPPGVRVWLAAGATDLRKGFDRLAVVARQRLGQDPFSGQLFVFRGRRGDLVETPKRVSPVRAIWLAPSATPCRAGMH